VTLLTAVRKIQARFPVWGGANKFETCQYDVHFTPSEAKALLEVLEERLRESEIVK